MSTAVQPVSLVKGDRVAVNLEKGTNGLSTAVVGLGWDVNKGNSGAFDLDAFCFFLRGGKYKSADDLIYFGKLQGPGVKHNGDNLTGAGDGDDEQIEITLEQIPADVDQIMIAVNIYQAGQRGQKFSQVDNAFIRIVDKATGREEQRYDLTEDFSNATAVVFGKLYRKDNEWKFQAIGEGMSADINGVAAKYA